MGFKEISLRNCSTASLLSIIMELINTLFEILLEWNLCVVMLTVYILAISAGGIIINFLPYLPVPDFFLQAFKFGKMSHDGPPWKILSLLEVPKRWFFHFYITASVIVTGTGMLMWNIYVSQNSLPHWMNTVLDILTIPDRRSTVNATTAAISLVMLALQIYRRLYENLFVSEFSSSRMNVIHYIVGHTHYVGAVALLVAQAPGFNKKDLVIDFSSVEIHHIIGMLVYICGFIVQSQSIRILADLRRKNGKKHVKDKHKMPEGGMFEIVSCPHMLAEVLVYVGILIILGRHTGWLIVTSWVVSNQIQVAVMNHKWYHETFKDYPRHRRAIFPFIL